MSPEDQTMILAPGAPSRRTSITGSHSIKSRNKKCAEEEKEIKRQEKWQENYSSGFDGI
jgi:hypothetical protein